MNICYKITLCILTLCSCTTSFAQSPNVLLIIADDLGVDAFNGYALGSFNPITPNLDSLRNSGITFTNAWASSVCTPTRAGIMSGKYGSKSGVKTTPGNLDTTHVSLLNALKDSSSNYSSAVIGKWHIAMPANPQHPVWHGADHYMGVIEGSVSAYDNWNKTENNSTAICTEYVTSYFTDDAISWISNQNDPWFLWLAHIVPHTPLHVPPSHMYSQPTTNTPLKKYMAMIESLDYEVGRLLDSMSPAELANTTILFIGDNGTPHNLLQDYPSQHGKQTLYQGGIHVPMFVSGNGVSRIGEVEDALIHVVDIYATILDLTGSDLPGGIYNSLSFKHLLSSSVLPKRQYNFTELDSNQTNINIQGHTIRNNEYKLIEYHNGVQEMYDLITDPLETTDLLLGPLSPQEQALKTELENEATQRKTAWSCKDDIQNGDEQGIDCGGTYCSPCSASSINQQSTVSNISVSPNPTDHSFTITSNGNEIEYIKVINSLGEIVFTKEIAASISTTIDLSHLKANIYYLQINLTHQTEVVKIIIE